MRQTSDGVVTELQGNATTTRRNLNIGRQLSTTVLYSVTNADSVEVVYRNSEDLSSTSMVITEDDQSSSNSSSTILIVILIISFIIGLVAIIILFCLYKNKCKRPQNRIRQVNVEPNPTEIEIRQGSQLFPNIYRSPNIRFSPEDPDGLNSENNMSSNRNFLDSSQNTKSRILNKYNDTSCSICLDRFKKGDKIIRINSCKHIFHKYCLKEWLNVSRSNRNCPNCRKRIERTMLSSLKYD